MRAHNLHLLYAVAYAAGIGYLLLSYRTSRDCFYLVMTAGYTTCLVLHLVASIKHAKGPK
jgi:hypothetical protein